MKSVRFLLKDLSGAGWPKTVKVAAFALAFLLFFGGSSFGVDIPVVYNLPVMPANLDVKVFNVDPGLDPNSPSDDIWTPAGSMDFGTLTLNETYFVFMASHFHAVDAVVRGNGAENWNITVQNNTIYRAAGDNLDGHVKIAATVAWWIGPDPDDTNELSSPFSMVKYGSAGTLSFSKSDILGRAPAGKDGWLRLYYGFATGPDPAEEGGATPPEMSQPAGQYTGQVIITLNVV